MLSACEVGVELFLGLSGSPQLQWLYGGGEETPLWLLEEVEGELERAFAFVMEREAEAPQQYQAIQSYRCREGGSVIWGRGGAGGGGREGAALGGHSGGRCSAGWWGFSCVAGRWQGAGCLLAVLALRPKGEWGGERRKEGHSLMSTGGTWQQSPAVWPMRCS